MTREHKEWYGENERKARELEERQRNGTKLTVKECDFVAWWRNYSMACPDPEKVPEHNIMVVKKDKDPMTEE